VEEMNKNFGCILIDATQIKMRCSVFLKHRITLVLLWIIIDGLEVKLFLKDVDTTQDKSDALILELTTHVQAESRRQIVN
jgi:type II secretory pathway component PulF